MALRMELNPTLPGRFLRARLERIEMFFSEQKDLAVKARSQFHRSAGVKSLTNLDPTTMAWGELTKTERAAQTEARKLLDAADSANTEERGRIENVIDTLTEIASAMAGEKDERTAAGTRDPMTDPKRPTYHGTARGVDAGDDPEHRAAFTDFLRAPHSRGAQDALSRFEMRSANSLTGAAGGFVVPSDIAGPILSRARDANPLRGVVRVVPVSTGDVVFPLSNGNATSGWVGETDTRTGTTEPTLAGKVPTMGVCYSYVEMSEEMAQDAAIDVGAWFSREAGAALGEAEMTAIISGDGTKKPTGLLNTAPEAGADGSRSANALRYLPATSATAITADEMLDLVYDVKAAYRANGRWLMNSATVGAVRKLKDSNGAYLWADRLSEAQPNLFAGYPVTICEAMPDIGADAHPVAFGDFERAYILAQRTGLTVTTDDNITTPGLVKFYIRHRIGGCVYDENAVRVLKNAAA